LPIRGVTSVRRYLWRVFLVSMGRLGRRYIWMDPPPPLA